MLIGILSFPLGVAKRKKIYFLVSWYSYYPNFIISIKSACKIVAS